MRTSRLTSLRTWLRRHRLLLLAGSLFVATVATTAYFLPRVLPPIASTR